MCASPRWRSRNCANALARSSSPKCGAASATPRGAAPGQALRAPASAIPADPCKGPARAPGSVRSLRRDVPDLRPPLRLLGGRAHQLAQLGAVHDLLVEQATRQLVEHGALAFE